MNTGTVPTEEIRKHLDEKEGSWADRDSWLRSLLEENERLKSEESWKAISEMAQREAQQLREELEQVKAERDRWKQAENEWQKKASLRQL